MDSEFKLTCGTTELAGVIRAVEAMQESEHGDANEHLIIFVLELNEPAVFMDSEGEKITVTEIHLHDTRALDVLSSSDKKCNISGVYYKRHSRTHHRPVIAEEIKLID